MRSLPPDFIEGRLLPLVIAFGCGVLLHKHFTAAELQAADARYAQALHEVENVRISCGLQPDPEAVLLRLTAGEVRQ